MLSKVLKRTNNHEQKNNIIHLDEVQLREHLDRKITESVEDTLNGLLDAEADRLCGAGRYERSVARRQTTILRIVLLRIVWAVFPVTESGGGENTAFQEFSVDLL